MDVTNMASKRMRTVINIAVSLLFILSILLLLFPIISARYSEKTRSRIISQYTEAVSLSEDTAIQDIYDRAVEYNYRLYNREIDATTPEGLNTAGYFSQLSVNGQDMMGYLHIPKLNVTAPIYHGTGEASMSRGVGHMAQSSLPVGGPNTHTVLSAHSGMAGFPGFSDLELLNPGDVFYIDVLGNTLTYEVYDIQTVLPDNIDPVSYTHLDVYKRQVPYSPPCAPLQKGTLMILQTR